MAKRGLGRLSSPQGIKDRSGFWQPVRRAHAAATARQASGVDQPLQLHLVSLISHNFMSTLTLEYSNSR